MDKGGQAGSASDAPASAASGRAELTGNHYLSFPQIDTRDAGVHSVAAMHAALGGIVAWDGDPLLRLRCGAGGDEPRVLDGLKWQRIDRWIPQAAAAVAERVTATVTFCAPGGYEPVARGGFIMVELDNRGAAAQDVTVVLDVRVAGTSLHVVRSRPLHSSHRPVRGLLHEGIAFETGVPASVAALGITADDATAVYDIDEANGAVPAHGASITLRVRVATGRTVRRAFYLGLGRDADSAIAHAAHLARTGAVALLREARLELAQLARRTPDISLTDIVNRNLLFNHYYALARALDDDRLYAVASRSPRHIPAAVVNERELLFWTLPCVTMTDPLLARELLRDTFEIYSAQPGLRMRYIDGSVVEPGFNLEQVLLYPLALDRYVRESGDDTILDDPLIQDVLREIDSGLDSYLHEDVLLCSTELLPGGELADQPYPTLGNAMLWAYADALPRIWRPGDDDPAPAGFDGLAPDISTAVWQRCMADVNGAQVFVSTTDLRNRSAVYDDPAMSLSLMPWFGFCRADDPTWRETMELLRSRAYPFWRDGRYPGLASRIHPAHASLAALCADLTGPRREAALDTLRRLRLPDGLACERYDADSGECAGGEHAAALAGFVAWSVMQALESTARTDGTRAGRKKKK